MFDISQSNCFCVLCSFVVPTSSTESVAVLARLKSLCEHESKTASGHTVLCMVQILCIHFGMYRMKTSK